MQAGRLEWTAPVVERTSRHTRQLVERMLSLTPSERPTPDEVRGQVIGPWLMSYRCWVGKGCVSTGSFLS